ncbi:hypothetical protein N1851_021838 [Merluccius polli]|uniref:Uncharacterized protein n=1 Tax=Merluccius polli TaxID=89951 RepID=A0AA47NWD9_MERPO|nr:hypothetical protein N1851_021838 [Merluccius polli]
MSLLDLHSGLSLCWLALRCAPLPIQESNVPSLNWEAAIFTDCTFIGEEESNSFYEDGDVVLGGVFPLHYTPVMGHISAKILLLSGMFLLNYLNVSSAAIFTDCTFIGEEESNSFYEDGDVVLGGVFPLHYTRVSSHPTYTSKPEPGAYK